MSSDAIPAKQVAEVLAPLEALVRAMDDGVLEPDPGTRDRLEGAVIALRALISD